MSQEDRTRIFAAWINEREMIRVKKENNEPRPWTADPILDTYRFCNVRREDDRVTQWVRYQWRTPFHDHPNLTLAMTLARFVNWPPTLEEIGFPKVWQPERVEKILKARKARGEKVWNAAYMISTCGARVDKVEHVVGVLNRVHVGPSRPLGGDTLETAWSRLKKINGLGNFLAAQIVADLKYAPMNPLTLSEDWWTWAAPGPGSERGLRWWLGRTQPVALFEFLPRLHDLIKETTPLIKEIVGVIHAQDYQNCLCEVSKFVKARTGGRPKQLYKSSNCNVSCMKRIMFSSVQDPSSWDANVKSKMATRFIIEGGPVMTDRTVGDANLASLFEGKCPDCGAKARALPLMKEKS